MTMKSYIIYITLILMPVQALIAQHDCYEPDASVWLNPWLSCSKSAHPIDIYDREHWIQYDFGAVRSLSKTWIWNVNDPDRLNAGFHEVSIHYSVDGSNWTHWGDITFPQGTGEAVYPGFSGPDLLGIDARYVILTGISNYGDISCSGLSEVKFNLFNKVDGSYRDIFDGEIDEDIPNECPTIADIGVEYYPEDKSAFFYWELSNEVDEELSYAFFFGLADEDDLEEIVVDEPFIFIEEVELGTEYQYIVEVICQEDYTSTNILTFLADTSTNSDDPHVSLDNSGVTILPNPVSEYFMLKGDLPNYNIDILNVEGQVISSINNVGQEQRIDISSLGVGMYFIKIKHQTNDYIDVQLMIKAE